MQRLSNGYGYRPRETKNEELHGSEKQLVQDSGYLSSGGNVINQCTHYLYLISRMGEIHGCSLYCI